MVFTKLSVQEKDAFFGLLDEYFQFRPELFGQSGNSQGASGLAGTGISPAAAASVVQRALAAGNANATGSGSGGAGGASGKSNNPYASSMPVPNSADVAHAMTVGRVAAASLAFSGAKPGDPGPPSLPRRVGPNNNAFTNAALERVGTPGMEVDKLVTKKGSVFSAFKKPETAGVVIPPAFVAPKNTFGPPPVRRAASDTNTSTGTGTGTGTGGVGGGRAVGTHQSEVAEGDWAEVVYDYSSEDPGDLAIEAGSRVFVTDKSSDDWWKGQVEGQGKQGLFPASYVTLL